MTRGMVTAGKPTQWAVPFMGRPSSSAVSLTGQSNITIRNKAFNAIGSNVSSIRLTNCSNVVIEACDFRDCCQPITCDTCTNIEIRWCRYKNITGPHARDGNNRANFTQWVNCTGGKIHHNKGREGDTEDIINLFGTSGTDAANPLIIEYNHFEGTNWTSTSGSGILCGDNSGSHIIVRYNKLLNPGQVGIGIAGGTDIRILDNIIYGEQRTSSNVGLYVQNFYAPQACNTHEVQRNKVSWKNAAGTDNPAFNAQQCGAITGWPVGSFGTNEFAATINPATLRVIL